MMTEAPAVQPALEAKPKRNKSGAGRPFHVTILNPEALAPVGPQDPRYELLGRAIVKHLRRHPEILVQLGLAPLEEPGKE